MEPSNMLIIPTLWSLIPTVKLKFTQYAHLTSDTHIILSLWLLIHNIWTMTYDLQWPLTFISCLHCGPRIWQNTLTITSDTHRIFHVASDGLILISDIHIIPSLWLMTLTKCPHFCLWHSYTTINMAHDIYNILTVTSDIHIMSSFWPLSLT